MLRDTAYTDSWHVVPGRDCAKVRPLPGLRRKGRIARRGAVAVLFIVALVPLVGFMAFAIDVGMLTCAQTQLRDAADASALAGCRAINGDTSNNNNYSGVLPAAQNALTNNNVLGSSLSTPQLTLNIGRYNFNASTQQFEGNFPGSSGNWNMVQATVTANVTGSLGFGKIFNYTLPNFQATATAAASRPRCLLHPRLFRFDALRQPARHALLRQPLVQ